MDSFRELCNADARALKEIFHDHPLVNRALRASLKVHVAREGPGLVEAGKRGPATPAWTLSRNDSYVVVIGKRLLALIAGLGIIDQVGVYLDLAPKPKTVKKANIHDDDWLGYHMTMFVAIMGALRDAAQLLVADSFDLGIHPKFVNLELLKRQRQLKDSDAIRILGEIDKLVQSRELRTRNRMLHRLDAMPDVELLDEPSRYLLALGIRFLLDQRAIDGGHAAFADWHLRRARAELQQLVRSRGLDMLRLLGDLCNAVEQQYDQWSGKSG